MKAWPLSGDLLINTTVIIR